ncbi:MAG: hypothetical protein EXS59_01475 [Candidatus Taylorbacteria bacterium]|nr:hypothetical protein [Candidatus Taylorbacteria bacterium]
MKAIETADLLNYLLVDGKWRRDALSTIILCMEKHAPWLEGVANEESDVWSPSNPWIDDFREAKYIELLRLGCRCIRESEYDSGIVTFGINVDFDIGALRGAERRRLISELQELNFMEIFYRPYQMYYYLGFEPDLHYSLPHPEMLLRNVL